MYENKPPDALLGQSEGDYLSKVMAYNVKREVAGLGSGEDFFFGKPDGGKRMPDAFSS